MYGPAGNATKDLGPESGRLPDSDQSHAIERTTIASVVEESIGFPVDSLALFSVRLPGVLLLGGT